MIYIYVVEINGGFGGEKYFYREENAKKYADTIKDKYKDVTIEKLEADEFCFYSDLFEFEDPYPLREKINVPFTVLPF